MKRGCSYTMIHKEETMKDGHKQINQGESIRENQGC